MTRNEAFEIFNKVAVNGETPDQQAFHRELVDYIFRSSDTLEIDEEELFILSEDACVKAF